MLQQCQKCGERYQASLDLHVCKAAKKRSVTKPVVAEPEVTVTQSVEMTAELDTVSRSPAAERQHRYRERKRGDMAMVLERLDALEARVAEIEE